MAKSTTTLFIIGLLLCSTLSYASARLTPTSVYHPEEISVKKVEQGEESCEGVGEEECFLIRRTLVAHTDYIYTQNHNP
ncbi:Phytosulfokines 5 [Cardamine amara subsp. amara]|uniref:Phytosulfokine n=1 Tax=Cardamine amara subsp. amara TaxID=228776 RepID=A0ABD0ZPA0_CARAN